jgi:uncharacterized OB-fold protein
MGSCRNCGRAVSPALEYCIGCQFGALLKAEHDGGRIDTDGKPVAQGEK